MVRCEQTSELWHNALAEESHLIWLNRSLDCQVDGSRLSKRVESVTVKSICHLPEGKEEVFKFSSTRTHLSYISILY